MLLARPRRTTSTSGSSGTDRAPACLKNRASVASTSPSGELC
jgi:hypothetical protein